MDAPSIISSSLVGSSIHLIIHSHNQPLPHLSWDEEDFLGEWERFKLHVQAYLDGPMHSDNATKKMGFFKLWIGDKGRKLFQDCFQGSVHNDPSVVLDTFERCLIHNYHRKDLVYNTGMSEQPDVSSPACCDSGVSLSAPQSRGDGLCECQSNEGVVLTVMMAEGVDTPLHSTEYGLQNSEGSVSENSLAVGSASTATVAGGDADEIPSFADGAFELSIGTLAVEETTNTPAGIPTPGSESSHSSQAEGGSVDPLIVADDGNDTAQVALSTQPTLPIQPGCVLSEDNISVTNPGTAGGVVPAQLTRQMTQESDHPLGEDPHYVDIPLNEDNEETVAKTNQLYKADVRSRDRQGHGQGDGQDRPSGFSDNNNVHGGRFGADGQSAQPEQTRSITRVDRIRPGGRVDEVMHRLFEDEAAGESIKPNVARQASRACQANNDVPVEGEAVEEGAVGGEEVGTLAATPIPDETPLWRVESSITDDKTVSKCPFELFEELNQYFEGHVGVTIENFMAKNMFLMVEIERCKNWNMRSLLLKHPAFKTYTLCQLKDDLSGMGLTDLVQTIKRIMDRFK